MKKLLTNTRVSLKPQKAFFMLMLSFCALLLQSNVQAQTYCTPTYLYYATYQCGISNVVFGSIVNNTGTPTPASYYTNFTGLSTTYSACTPVPFALTAGPGNSTNFGVWVDWNKDGTFNTSGTEQIVISGQINVNAVYSNVINIPVGTAAGSYRVRFAGDIGFSAPGPCYIQYTGDVEDYTLNVTTPSGTDITMLQKNSPSQFIVGNNTVVVKVQNKGVTTINSATLGYQLGSATAFTENVNFPSGLNSCASYDHTFSTAVNLPSAGSYTLKIWATAPNGTYPDNITANDTITLSICTGLSGTYTIDPAGSGPSNFLSFTTAVAALNNCGLTGPVIFNVAASTYSEQITLSPINGSNTTNTVTFNGGAGNASSRILEFTATTLNNKHTVKFTGGSNIRFRNLTIQTKAAAYGWAVLIKSNSRNIFFKNCIIQNSGSGVGSTSQQIQPIVITNDDSYYYTTVTQVNNIEVDSSIISGGYFNVSVYGNQIDVYDLKFRNNTFTDCYYSNIYFITGMNVHVINNKMSLRNNSTQGQNMYLQSMTASGSLYNEISGNEIFNCGQYGINLYIAQNPGTRGKVFNNTIGGGFRYAFSTNAGINITQSSNNWDVWHNSVNMDVLTTTGTDNAALWMRYSVSGIDVRNNIFAVTTAGSPAFPVWAEAASNFSSMNYNNYYKVNSDNSTVLINFNNATMITKGALKGAQGLNQNSTSEFPLFISNTNLRLNTLGISPFGDASLGITKDIDNKTRCALYPSMGASESPYVVSANAGIVAEDTVFINSPTTIFNTATQGEPKTHLWTIDSAGNFITLNVKHTFISAGTYKIRLITSGCLGIDSAFATIVVVVPTVPPVSAFLADVNNADQNAAVQLTDLSTGGPTAWVWTAIPSAGVTFLPNANVQNPQVVFSNVGTYQICLKASNIAGAGNLICKSAYINVTEVNMLCGTKLVSKSATGKVFDSGGKNADYAFNQNCSFLLDPCASSVTLSFASFSLGTGDILRIYDGKDASGTALHTGSGYTGIIKPQDITAKSGKMFIRFTSDGAANSSGFEAIWTSVAKPFNKPAAGFKVPDTLYTGTIFTFNNNSTGVEPELAWDFNNDGVTDATSANPTYTFATAGTYIVSLRITDCGGTDGAAKSVVVVNPTTAPVPNFISNFTIISPGQVVNFYDRSTQAPTNWTWTVSPSDYNYIGGTDSSSQNPQIKFNAVGNYNITLLAKNSFGQTAVTKPAFIKVVNYCFPGAGLNTDIGITRVTFAGIDNVTTVGPITYSNFTQTVQSAAVQKGGNYNITLERITNKEEMTRKVWIDWDGNGVFSASELVASEAKGKTLTWTGAITVPSTIAEGSTRMRIGTSYGTTNNSPCGPNPYGEFEDYTITIYNNLVRPVITMIGSPVITMEVGSAYTDSGATAFDDIEGNVTGKMITTNNVPANQGIPGTYYFRYNVSDLEGNSAEEKVRTIIITPDITPPVLTLLGTNPMSIPTGSLFVDPGATAFDSFDGNITNKIVVTGGPVNSNVVGQYILTYSVSDMAGNMVVATRTIDVGDTVAPRIILIGADTVYLNLGVTYNDAGAVVVDNFDQGLVYNVDLTGINNMVLGAYVLTYTSQDNSGNQAIPVKRVVIVRDVTAPVLTLNKDVVDMEVFTSYKEPVPPYTITDNYYSSFQVNRTGNVDTSKIGTFYYMYIAVDGSGNSSVPVIRTVNVKDTKAPVLTLNGDKFMTVCRWAIFTDPLYTSSDNYDQTPTVTVKGSVDMLKEGIYSLIYQAEDQSGNKSPEVERLVRVLICSANANGVQDYSAATEVTLYPNPSSGLFNLSVNRTDMSNFDITVKDVLGRTVNAGVTKYPFDGRATIDLYDEAAGMYFVTVTINNETLTQKIKVIK